MMDTVLLSYLFSLLPMAGPDEFLKLRKLLREGANIRDKDFLNASPVTRKLTIDRTFSSLLNAWQDDIKKAEDQGARFTFPGEADYPEGFLLMREPAFFVSYFGSPMWLERPCFSVVGSREPGELSEIWCENVFPGLLQRLPGVDQIIHRIALRNQSPTLVLLPSGLLQLYPEQIALWKEKIVGAGGALISEFLPGRRMQKHYFHQRNRLIAGISFATLIVEARRKSGTMITAKHAAEQGKPLFVLPSHPLDSRNQGALDLLIEGATPIRDAEDLYIYMCSELSAVKWRGIALGGSRGLAP
jgi:DNA processing protein